MWLVCSDEDDDDKHALLYLPITPEIEDVEDSHTADQQQVITSVRTHPSVLLQLLCPYLCNRCYLATC